MTGPLAAYTDGFRGYLAGLGYAPSSAQDQLRPMADVSRWLDGQAADASGLTTERIAEFLRTRRGSYVRLVSGRALAPMLGFLRGLAVTPPQPAPVPGTRVDQLVEAYRRTGAHRPSRHYHQPLPSTRHPSRLPGQPLTYSDSTPPITTATRTSNPCAE